MPMIGRRFYPGMKRGTMGFMQSGDFPVPVAHYKFGKNTGAVAYDSSPEGNDGDIQGPTWVKGYLGPGLLFDDLDDYVNCGDILNFAGFSPFTVIVRAKLEEATTGYPRFMSRERWTPTRDGYTIFISTSDELMVLSRYVNGVAKNVSMSAIYGEWIEPAIVYNGSLLSLYNNGALVDSVADVRSMNTFSANLAIGATSGFTSNFNGIIDEVVAFDEGLSARQMRQWNLGIR